MSILVRMRPRFQQVLPERSLPAAAMLVICEHPPADEGDLPTIKAVFVHHKTPKAMTLPGARGSWR